MLLQAAEPGRLAGLTQAGITVPPLFTPAAISDWLQKNVAAGRESRELWFHAGLSYLDLHAFAPAREAFFAALRHSPGYGNAISGLAVAELGLGNVAEAVAWHLKILKASRLDVISRNSLLRLMKRADVPATLARAMFKAIPLKYYENHPADDAAVSPVATFADWCARAGVPVHELDAARDVGPADGVVNTPAYTADAVRVAEIANARAISNWDFVIAPTGEVLDGSGVLPLQATFNSMPHYLQDGHRSVIHVWPQEEIEVTGPVLFLSSPPFRNVGHWITDFLPRLRASAAISARPFRYFLPRPPMRRYLEFLAMFGIAERDLIYVDIAKRARFEKLYVMGHLDHNRPHPQIVQFMRQRLSAPAATPSRLIYLRRSAGAFGRRPLNQVEVDGVLASFAIMPVDLAELSPQQQRDVLGDAALVVTSCGAEMASIFSLPPGCEIIALVPSNDATFSDTGEDLNQFRRQADLLGMRIQLLPCQPAAGASRIFNRDITVDCGALSTAIETAMRRRAQS